jgi:hypothetical protein
MPEVALSLTEAPYPAGSRTAPRQLWAGSRQRGGGRQLRADRRGWLRTVGRGRTPTGAAQHQRPAGPGEVPQQLEKAVRRRLHGHRLPFAGRAGGRTPPSLPWREGQPPGAAWLSPTTPPPRRHRPAHACCRSTCRPLPPLEVVLPHGTVLRLTPGCDLGWVRSLVEAFRGAAVLNLSPAAPSEIHPGNPTSKSPPG